MKLYHGTSASRLDSILSRGLRPRGKQRSNWPSYPSRQDCVYLSSAYAPYFALSATDEGEKSLILEVDVDVSTLLPDEDFVAQSLAGATRVSVESIHDGIRDNLEDYSAYAEDSLRMLGNACHKGVIEASRITRYAIIDWSQQQSLLEFAIDPTISLLNFRLCGGKYRSITAWIFGDRDDFEVGYGAKYLETMESLCPGYTDRILQVFSNRSGIALSTEAPA